jgi:hypothetical protein
MLKLIDLLRLSGITLTDWKIHCATGLRNPPLEAFFDGRWKSWQEQQNQKNFECDKILSLIHLGGSQWLFAGVYEVLGVKKGAAHNPEGYEYSTEEVAGLDHLTGKAIVQFDKSFRASYLLGPNYENELLIAALRTVVREEHPSWYSALSNVGGVYVITDNTSGKHYVGSAYGGLGIWNRWIVYAKNGHGGNVELQQLLVQRGAEHADNFQFSILEVCDRDASDDFIIGRESHWKTVLRTREHGLNSN